MATKLETLLEQEYQALLGGDLAEIERFGAVKVNLLESVSALPASELSKFESLRARLIRNQLLAHSAIEGMRAAINRATEVNEVSSSLRIYGQNGRNSVVGVRTGGTLSKRS